MRSLSAHKYNEFFRHLFHTPVFWLIIGIAVMMALFALAVWSGGGGGSGRYPYYFGPYYMP